MQTSRSNNPRDKPFCAPIPFLPRLTELLFEHGFLVTYSSPKHDKQEHPPPHCEELPVSIQRLQGRWLHPACPRRSVPPCQYPGHPESHQRCAGVAWVLQVSVHTVRDQPVRVREEEGEIAAQASVGGQTDRRAQKDHGEEFQHLWVPGKEGTREVFGVRANRGRLRVVSGGVEQSDQGMVGKDHQLDVLDEKGEGAGKDASAIGLVAFGRIRTGVGRRDATSAEIAGHEQGGGEGGGGQGWHCMCLSSGSEKAAENAEEQHPRPLYRWQQQP